MRINARIAAPLVATSLVAGMAAPAYAQESNAPKNIIYMVGDGMGYGHIAYNNIYETGQSKYTVDGEFGAVTEQPGESVQTFEDFNRLSMTTFPNGGSYDPEAAWGSHTYVDEGATDSAAAGTAMATGMKVQNGTLGVSAYGHAMENTSERAIAQGKAAGVVSSVQFFHATPAAWSAHNKNRNNYTEIANEIIKSDLSVVMGAGHPEYDDSNVKRDTPDYSALSQADFESLKNGSAGWQYVEAKESFEALANGDVEADKKYFGLAPVSTTLQQARAGAAEAPYSDPRNDVTDLATMTKGALNVLGQDEDGFHVMIEGGAIDWTGHANDSAREIEEVQDFNAAVDAAVAWVEENSSWDETLLIVTADHETGYLSGAEERGEGGEGVRFNAMNGEKGIIPEGHDWYSGDHTNQVVPFFFKGAGSEDIKAKVTGTDPVRGDYIDNTTVAKLTLEDWWFGEGSGNGGDSTGSSSQPEGSSVSSGFAGAGIAAAVIEALAAIAQATGLVKILPGDLRF
ncbi:alkaline phosphatase [Corynebacterium endometrii]|uniref:Alkaline phosphatase 4 n=1 Tax=Corynebacterium endometrii TaxID=2488819 RepID=A0A4P7QFL5_9CORY|nr:alkaline phosphatase [Corynebacterium endometrii]QCB27427.1 Alkaline phosphatase 4 precursor [Corynebacterium endometrii]